MMRTTHLATVALASTLILAGCSTPPPQPTPPSVAEAGSTTSPSPSPSTTPSPAAPAKSERGNLIKKPGDSFGYSYEGQQVANFVVSKLTVDPKCTGDYVDPPEFGHFVQLDVQGETTASLPDDIFIAGGSWSVIAENGTTFNGDPWSYAATGCLNEPDRLPNIIGAGERVAGAVILDVPTTHGTIVLDLGNGAAWEWQY